MSAIGPRVSLCMIVKNESKNLRACLQPVASLFDEVIVVDTGSTDGTHELAAELGASVHHFPWRDDFSAARNFSVEQAQGDWIFWLDADDRIDFTERQKLAQLIENLPTEPRAFMLRTFCRTSDSSEVVRILPHIRLFPRDPAIRWNFRVHEQIINSINVLRMPIEHLDIKIRHVGYTDPALTQRKMNRDLRLLRLDYLSHPDEPSVLMHLGGLWMRMSNWPQAVQFLLQALQKAASKTQDWVHCLYLQIQECLRKLGRSAEALGFVEEGLTYFPDDGCLLNAKAELLTEAENHVAAVSTLETILKKPSPRRIWHSPEPATVRNQAKRLLSQIYLGFHKYREAEQLLQELLADNSESTTDWFRLGMVYLDMNQPTKVDFVLRQLPKCPDGVTYSRLLEAMARMNGGQWERSRILIEQVIAEAPQFIMARLVNVDWHVRTNADADSCLDALRDVLRLDPGNRAASAKMAELELRKAQPTPPQTFYVGIG